MKTKKLKRQSMLAGRKMHRQKRKTMQKHIDFSNQITARLHAAKVDAICLEPKWKGYWKAFWYGLGLRFKRYRRDVRRARR